MRSSAFFLSKLQTYPLKSHLRNSISSCSSAVTPPAASETFARVLSYGSLDIPPSLLGLTCEGREGSSHAPQDRTELGYLVRQVDQRFVAITPSPTFRRIIALDDRMAGRVEVAGRMFAVRLVATPT
jgi:hypothetical protein